MQKKTEHKVTKPKREIPPAPIKSGIKSVLLWWFVYKTKQVVFLIITIALAIMFLSVVSITIDTDKDGKLQIKEIKLTPIETKVNIGE